MRDFDKFKSYLNWNWQLVLCSSKSKSYFTKIAYFKGLEKKSAFSKLWSRNLFAWIQKVKDISRAKSNSTVVYKKKQRKTFVNFVSDNSLHCTKNSYLFLFSERRHYKLFHATSKVFWFHFVASGLPMPVHKKKIRT